MYRGIDSYRALAFLAVFAFHARLLPCGHLGVQAFFVLSGFLLIPILIAMKQKLYARNFFINFYGRRALRIFPLYYLYLLMMLAIALVVTHTRNDNSLVDMQQFLKQAPWALTFTYNFLYSSRFFENTLLLNHFWSLAVEEQFYLVLPTVIFMVHEKHLKKFLLAIIFLGPVLRLLIAILVKGNAIQSLNQDVAQVIYALTLSHLDAFAIGGYFALYQKSDKSTLPTLSLFMLSILLGYVSQYVSTQQVALVSLGYFEFMPYGYQYVWGYSLINLVFAKTALQFKDGKFFPLLFDNRLLNYLGKISYGLYVFHCPIIWLVRYTSPSLTTASVALISIALTLAIGSISYELYEKKFLSLKEKFFSTSG